MSVQSDIRKAFQTRASTEPSMASVSSRENETEEMSQSDPDIQPGGTSRHDQDGSNLERLAERGSSDTVGTSGQLTYQATAEIPHQTGGACSSLPSVGAAAASQANVSRRRRKQMEPIRKLPDNARGDNGEESRKGETRRKRKKTARQVRNPFLIQEARCDEEEDEEESCSDGEQQLNFVVEDDSQPLDDNEFHRRVDALNQEDEIFVAPYFPTALAVSPQRPLQFDFGLFVMDSLKLPMAILARGETEAPNVSDEVKFNNVREAMDYCKERITGWRVDRTDRPATPRQCFSHPQLEKKDLFLREGVSMRRVLSSGEERLDRNLHLVRADRFDNVMIFNAPPWSPASVQFTHGFPRRLIDAEHGGFLPGNVIAAAAASNLCLRRLAVCDVASLISKRWISSAGLSYGRLLNLRYAAIRYHRGTYLPQYLVCGMTEFGVNFATFDPLTSETLEYLAEASRPPWTAVDEQEEEEDGECRQVALAVGVMESLGQQATTDGDQDSAAEGDTHPHQTALTNLLSSWAHGESDSAEDEVAIVQATPSARSSQGARKRKRKSGSSSSSSVSSSGRRQVGETSREPPVLDGASSQQSSPPRRDENGAMGLLSIPLVGFKVDVFPSGKAREDLFQFLSKYKPIPHAEVEGLSNTTAARRLGTDAGEVVHSCEEAVRLQRRTTVNTSLCELYRLCRQSCTCDSSCQLLEALTSVPTENGQLQVAPSGCPVASRCRVCRVFVEHMQVDPVYMQMATNKNKRLAQLLACSTVVRDLYELAVPEMQETARRERKTKVKQLLCRLLECGENRLNCIRNVGGLLEVAPKIGCVQLESGGFSQFWYEMRKIGKAVSQQSTHQCKVAAVMVFRRQLDAGSPWASYLTTEDSEQERRLLRMWDASVSASGSAARH